MKPNKPHVSIDLTFGDGAKKKSPNPFRSLGAEEATDETSDPLADMIAEAGLAEDGEEPYDPGLRECPPGEEDECPADDFGVGDLLADAADEDENGNSTKPPRSEGLDEEATESPEFKAGEEEGAKEIADEAALAEEQPKKRKGLFSLWGRGK